MALQIAVPEGKYISLTTFRRNGEPVSTPVEFVVLGGFIYVRTVPGSGKVKRLRGNHHVRLASCTMGGKVRGQYVDGDADLVEEEKDGRIHQEFERKYGLFYRLGSKLRKERSQMVRIQLLT